MKGKLNFNTKTFNNLYKELLMQRRIIIELKKEHKIDPQHENNMSHDHKIK
jgi:hypothetical protein